MDSGGRGLGDGPESAIRSAGRRNGGETVTGALAKRALDIGVSSVLLLALSLVIVGCAAAVRLNSPGPAFYRCTRMGRDGRPFSMLKFRKMWVDASGPPLTSADDDRFTSVGRFLATSKLDELPQLWNVLKGEMSLVGPRPEDPYFVRQRWDAFEPVLDVKPGITGLSQLAFARESEVLDRGDPELRTERYEKLLLPQKIGLDTVYARHRSMAFDLRILGWTFVAVVLRKNVAVHRVTGRLTLRRRPASPDSVALQRDLAVEKEARPA